MTTLRDQAIRLVDREPDHHRRGAPHRVRALRRGTADAHVSATSPSVPTATRSRTSSRRRARTRCATSCSLRNLEVKQIKQKKTLQRARAHAAARAAAGDHALLAPDGGVRAHRHPDHRRARGHRGRLGQQALPARSSRRCASRSTTACRSPTRSPSTPKVFPPYYIGILRSAELTGQLDTALEQLSGYIERDLEAKSKIKAALIYPMVILGMSIVTVVILAVWVHAEVRRVLQEPRREAAAADACC